MSDTLLLTAPVEIRATAGDTKLPTIFIEAYGGGLMKPPGFPELVIDESGMDLPEQVPLLADHKNAIDATIGHGKPSIEAGKLVVRGVLSRGGESTERIIQLSRDGVKLGASVGFLPTEREHIPAGQSLHINNRTITAGPNGLLVVRRGTLKEVSVTPIAADDTTSVSIAASNKNRGITMTTTNDVSLLPEDAEGLSPQERIQARWSREQWHDLNGMPRQRAQQAMLAASAGRLDYADFENQLLREKAADSEIALIRATAPKGPAIHAGRHALPADAKSILAAAALHYLGKDSIGEKEYGPHVMQAAADLGLRSVYDLARYALHESHHETPVAGEALLKAAFSTAILPTALADSAGKIARAAFMEQSSTWRSWCDVVPVTDFKSKTMIRVSGTKGLSELPPSGEIHHDVLTESTGTVQAATYAKMLAIPRQLLINDDLGAIPQVASDFGKMGARKVASLVYTALLANAGSFFSEANGNLITDTLSAAGLAAALLAFRSQTDEDSEPIDIVPKVLIVGPTLEPTARALLNSEALQRYVADGTDNQPMGNPWSALNLTLEVEPRLEASGYTGYSSTQWYLAAGPSAQAAVVAFLNGQQGATVESAETDFATLGQQWRCYIDVGGAMVEKKAIVKSTGAGE